MDGGKRTGSGTPSAARADLSLHSWRLLAVVLMGEKGDANGLGDASIAGLTLKTSPGLFHGLFP